MKLFKSLNKNDSIEEIQNKILFKTYFIATIIGLPILIYNIYFYNKFNESFIGYFHIVLIIPIVCILCFYKNLKYKLKVYILLIGTFSLGAYNLYVAGYAGAGIMLLITVVNFASIFLPQKHARFSLILSIITMIAFGVLYSTDVVTVKIDISSMLESGMSWSIAIFLFTLLCTIFVSSYSIIIKSLVNKIELIRNNEKELSEKNIELQNLLNKNNKQNQVLEDLLHKAEESNKLKTEFLHNLSHEVRTPLNGIVGFSSLLKKENLSDQKQNEYTDIIIQSSYRLQKVIDNIVEVSINNIKQEKLNIENIDITKYLKELYSIFSIKNNEDVKLSLNIDHSANIIIESDTDVLTKILGNIVENSIKFTSKGEIEIGLINKEDSIIIYVKDTGIGIKEKNIERIFHRFSQANSDISKKYGGLGLGLNIVKENADLLNLEISVESQYNKGTTFLITHSKSFKNKCI